MSTFLKFFVDYGVDGPPVVYKVDDALIKCEINKDGAFETNIKFDMHVATEEELGEYGKTEENDET